VLAVEVWAGRVLAAGVLCWEGLALVAGSPVPLPVPAESAEDPAAEPAEDATDDTAVVAEEAEEAVEAADDTTSPAA
jgi:hypothetical protein